MSVLNNIYKLFSQNNLENIDCKDGEIEAELWEIKIYDNVFDYLHRHSRTIKELYIKKLNIAINFESYNSYELNIINKEDLKNRYNNEATLLKKVKLSKELVDKINILIISYQNFKISKQNTLKDLENIFISEKN